MNLKIGLELTAEAKAEIDRAVEDMSEKVCGIIRGCVTFSPSLNPAEDSRMVARVCREMNDRSARGLSRRA